MKSKRVSLAVIASGILLGLGIAALLASIIYESSILAFIGLGLSFWGALLLYIQDQDYVPKLVLDASVLPSLSTVDQMIHELGFRGDAIYLPPKYFEDPETTRIYVARREDSILPTPEEIEKYENRLIIENPQGMLLTPPGSELTKLLEKTMETSFTKVDLKYLQKNMPKLFIEDLEIAENLELQAENDTIRVTVTNSIFNEISNETSKNHVSSKIGSPLCSAIACALTKATGEPIMIEKIQRSDDGRTIEATYRIVPTKVAEKQTEEALVESVENVTLGHSRLIHLAGAFLIVCGSAILAWISWLTWYDMTTYGKDIKAIFFGSRTGEAISLGIDMKVIYYFLIGLALVVSGLVTLGAKRALEKKRLKTVEQAPVDHRGGKTP
jgi:hypothetical protein